MKNEEMIAGRFAQLHKSRSILKKINEVLAMKGGHVVVTTYTRATRYKNPSDFRIIGRSLYARFGKKMLCVDHCGFRFFADAA